MATTVKDLRTQYPQTFGDCHFVVDSGWNEVLAELGRTLEGNGDNTSFTSIREKYADLEVWPHPKGLRSKDAVEIARTKCRRTCETCGKPGRWVTSANQWESIACRTCAPISYACEDPWGDNFDGEDPIGDEVVLIINYLRAHALHDVADDIENGKHR